MTTTLSRGATRASLLLALAAIPLLAGCGTLTVDKGEAENLVRQQVETDGVKLKSVDCPDDAEAKKGEKFKCKATPGKGEAVTFTLEVKSVKDDTANIEIIDAH